MSEHFWTAAELIYALQQIPPTACVGISGCGCCRDHDAEGVRPMVMSSGETMYWIEANAPKSIGLGLLNP